MGVPQACVWRDKGETGVQVAQPVRWGRGCHTFNVTYELLLKVTYVKSISATGIGTGLSLIANHSGAQQNCQPPPLPPQPLASGTSSGAWGCCSDSQGPVGATQRTSDQEREATGSLTAKG